jgi:hypothetical protein
MNTLRTLWENGYRLHDDLELTFSNKKLVSYKVEPTGMDHIYTREVVESLIQDLIKKEMITFWDDVPNMSVSVPIQEIGMDSEEGNEEEPLFIETFHHDEDDEDNWLHDRGHDVPMLLHKFLGFKREVNHTSF